VFISEFVSQGILLYQMLHRIIATENILNLSLYTFIIRYCLFI